MSRKDDMIIMNRRIAKFEKVSFEQFKKDVMDLYASRSEFHNSMLEREIKACKTDADIDNVIRECYDQIKLPVRGTAGSAGYDFFAPAELCIPHDTAFVVPTGIKCKIEDGWMLDINPRSGLGFKSGMRLANSRGIIDSDYYNNKNNEGHIMIKIVNESCILGQLLLDIDAGKAFAQGIFTIYGLTEDDDVTAVREGGIGSTSRT